MIALSILQIIRSILLVLFSVFGGVVEELPFGMQTAVDTFASSIHGVIAVFPILEQPYTLFIWAIGIKITLLTITFIMWVIERIR